MSLPSYPAYKASGVEWLGEVPEHWDVTALKRGFNVTLGKMLQPESSSPDDELLPYLRAANIQWGGVDTTDIKQMWLSKRDRTQLRLESGDLLVSEGGDVGRSCLWAAELDNCYFQNSVNRVRARDEHSNRYLYYWMSTIKDKGYIDVLCNKSTIAHFTAEKVAAVPVPLPNPAEQTKIAAFLNRETGKIDALIAEQRRLVVLLAEKRQAVISHAVTKGLNPNFPMKDSGIEWLGEVPEHWEVKRLKYVGKAFGGLIYDPSEIVEEGYGTLVLRSSNVQDGRVVFDDNVYVTTTIPAKIVTQNGDILVCSRNGSRALIGKNAMIDDESSGVTFGAFMMVFRSGNNGYIFHVFNSQLFKFQSGAFLTATINQLTVGNLYSMEVPLPPADEQQTIAAFLNRENAQFDTLTAEANRAVELLQERRSALISAAVTGKIDVRDLALSR